MNDQEEAAHLYGIVGFSKSAGSDVEVDETQMTWVVHELCVIARNEATKQSRGKNGMLERLLLDCFASLAMTAAAVATRRPPPSAATQHRSPWQARARVRYSSGA